MSTAEMPALQFFQTVAALALVSIFYGTVLRRMGPGWPRQVVLGLVFGAAALSAMVQPIPMAPGVIVDMRHLPVALAGAFAGPWSMAIALSMTAAARIAIGGGGMLGGLIGMTLAGLAGALWAQLFLARKAGGVPALLVLAGMVSTNLLGAAALPRELALDFFARFALPMAAFNVVGVLVIGGAIRRERLLARSADDLQQEADRDALTGTLNRRGFRTVAQDALSRARPHGGNAVLLVDADHFKRVNDSFGHDVGDAVLVELTRRLGTALRAGDALGRFGGEEFVVLARSIDRDGMRLLAERLHRAINREPFPVAGRRIDVTVSMGGWWFGADGDLDEAMRRADAFLYEAKRAGRDRFVLGPGAWRGETSRPVEKRGIEARAMAC